VLPQFRLKFESAVWDASLDVLALFPQPTTPVMTLTPRAAAISRGIEIHFIFFIFKLLEELIVP
jgi:hypothetical protein